MNYLTFKNIVNSVTDCKNLDMFIAERGWQDWMDKYTNNDENDSDKLAEILTAIWDVFSAENSFKKLIEISKISQSKFSRDYGIPLRTVQGWILKEREAPQYVIELFAFAVFSDKGIL